MSKKQRTNRRVVYSRFVTIRDKFGKARTEIDWVPLEGVALEEPGGWDPSAHYCYELTNHGKHCGVWKYLGTIDSVEGYNACLEHNILRVVSPFESIAELLRSLSMVAGSKYGSGLVKEDK